MSDTDLRNASLEIRSAELEYREDAESGYLEGIAVPWDQTVTIHNPDGTSFLERFENGSVELDGTVWLYDSHKTPIGVVEAAESRSEGLFIRAKLALSDLARSVYEQLLNGARNKLSVGFTGLEHREEDGVVVRTRTRLREVSVVERPAYSLASVLAVREETLTEREPLANEKENTVTENTASAAELAEVRGYVEELEQRVNMLPASAPAVEKADTRSAGEIVKAMANGDEETIARVTELQTRAYTGGTSADSPIKDAWVGNLTEIFDASSGVLSQVFRTGALPEQGMNVEFARRLPATNTLQVTEQAAEGDDLAFGKLTLETDSAPVKTYGGYSQLTIQEIKRSTLPVLNTTLEGLAEAAGARQKLVLRSAFNTVRAAQVTASNTVALGEGLDDANHINWANLVVDAAIKFEAKNAPFEVLLVSPDVFKHLNSIVVNGNKVFKVSEDKDTIGRLNLPGLTGDLAGVTVVADTGATGALATFVNGRALKHYSSGLVSLQDDNIINLSRSFSVYRFGAVADEIPDFIVPVVIPAND